MFAKTNKMKRMMFIIVLLIGPVIVEASAVHFFILSYNQGNMSVIEHSIIDSSDSTVNSRPYSHYIDSFDKNGNLLNTTFFNIPKTIYWDNWDENGTIIGGGSEDVNYTEATVYVPYMEEAVKMIVYNASFDEMLEIDLAEEMPPNETKDKTSLITYASIFLMITSIAGIILVNIKWKTQKKQ
jgi:hypothetical protein